MTLAQFRTAIAAKLGLDNTAASAEQVLIDSWVNAGVLDLLLRTHCTVESATMATTVNVWDYQLDTDILAIRDIWREETNGEVDPVIRVTEEEILDLHRSTSASSAAFTRYAVAGSNMLLVWPTPSTAYTLHILYVPRPTALAAVGDDPSSATLGRIPREFHKGIEYYALWQGAEYDENQTAQGGERFRVIYETFLLQTIRPALRQKGGRNAPRARTKSWRTRRLVSDPDRYPG